MLIKFLILDQLSVTFSPKTTTFARFFSLSEYLHIESRPLEIKDNKRFYVFFVLCLLFLLMSETIAE